MSIVLNEHEWAKEMIDARKLGKKPFETLTRVTKYYLDKGYSKKDARKATEQFILHCDPSTALPKWAETLDYAMARALKYDAIQIDGINITSKEIEKIDSLPGKQMRRLAFTLLCLAKYWDAINPACDHWVNNKDSDIMRMANINTSIKRQSVMYYHLNEADMIQFSKRVDNTNVRVNFIEDSDVILTITDFRNLGYQYLKYHGEPYFECKNCGLTTKMNEPYKGAKQKYCKECASEIATRQRINSVMRQREKLKSHNNS